MFIIIELYDNYESRNIFGPFKTLSEAKEQACKRRCFNVEKRGDG